MCRICDFVSIQESELELNIDFQTLNWMLSVRQDVRNNQTILRKLLVMFPVKRLIVIPPLTLSLRYKAGVGQS